MLMPSKIVKPVDSIFCISAYVISILSNKAMTIDSLHKKINEEYLQVITIDRLLLCLNFLYIIDAIRIDDEVITIKI